MALGYESLSDSRLESIVLNNDLVIQGEIIDVNVTRLNAHEVFGGPHRDLLVIVTLITMRIERVIAGEYGNDTIDAIIREGRIDNESNEVAGHKIINPKLGETVLIGLAHNLFGQNRYILAWREAFFKIEDRALLPYDDYYRVDIDSPFEIIESTAKKRSFEALFSSSDIVCVGQSIENNLEKRNLNVKVNDILKGNISMDRNISIDYSAGYSLDYIAKDRQILLFLMQLDESYVINQGINGIYLIENGALIRRAQDKIHKDINSLKDEFMK